MMKDECSAQQADGMKHGGWAMDLPRGFIV